jgi:hypothetical protein
MRRNNHKKNKQLRIPRELDPFLGHVDTRKITLAAPIYVVNTALGLQGYTFNSSVSQGGLALVYPIHTNIASNVQFTALAAQYGLFKIKACGFRVLNTQNLNLANTFTSLPAFAVDLIPIYSSVNSIAAYNSDTSLMCSVNNTNRAVSKIYPLNGVIQTAIGYPIAGSAIWMATVSYGSNNQLYAAVGFGIAPVASATSIFQVAELEIDVYVDFAKPFKLA